MHVQGASGMVPLRRAKGISGTMDRYSVLDYIAQKLPGTVATDCGTANMTVLPSVKHGSQSGSQNAAGSAALLWPSSRCMNHDDDINDRIGSFASGLRTPLAKVGGKRSNLTG